MGAPSREEVDRFAAVIAERLGLEVDDVKLRDFARVMQERVRETRAESAAAYLVRLIASKDELRAVADALTVNESYFFRYAEHFRAFAEVALPDRERHRGAGRPLRILSAGCASGEEPYTLAMLVSDHGGSGGTEILGIDVSGAALRRAALGRYSSWSLRETPPTMQKRWFHAEGKEHVLDPQIRAMVRFEERNLLDDDAQFWARSRFDVVFCRNVTIYFGPDRTRDVIARITRALAPGGYLFLGHSENLRGVSGDFDLQHTHGTFYYKMRDAHGDERAGVGTGSWADDIQRTHARIEELARRSRDAEPPREERAADLARATELARQERFGEALQALSALPSEAEKDVDALLLRAALLTNRGDVRDAERACEQILGLDTLNAGAHYLMALCREQAGDRAAAIQHDETAIYLSPTFAMPHLHLGLLARRGADVGEARRRLTRALALLALEEAPRVLLFGGGFNRDALMRLCRGELAACGDGE